ncbi:hypothetical protein [Hydrogenoanaerobacterium sp.]|uniref:hypothetical protein n=1 Tax=Hydrogenoanaerobacterium sp. TaxID=2953763 RepID=UPI00289EC2BC|nr:hypothetical protein [Hydrogenoanaerobacterium sp.]
MSKYTYKTFPANFVPEDGDKEGKRVHQATINFGHDGDACYVIYINGQMNTIQFEGELPYPAETLEQAAELHIAALQSENG